MGRAGVRQDAAPRRRHRGGAPKRGAAIASRAPQRVHRVRQGDVRRGPRDHGGTDGLLLFREIIDPYSVSRQDADVGKKYHIGVHSEGPSHLWEAEAYIQAKPNRDRLRVEVLPLTHYVPSAGEHRNHLDKLPRRLPPYPQRTHKETPSERVIYSILPTRTYKRIYCDIT